MMHRFSSIGEKGQHFALSILIGGLAPTALFASESISYKNTRLVIADRNDGSVDVYDGTGRQLIESFLLESPARLYSGPTGRFVYAIQSLADRVDVLDLGLHRYQQGKLMSFDWQEPTLLDFSLQGFNPIHFSNSADQVAVFFDGEGFAKVFNENGEHLDTSEVLLVDSGLPHHGVAVPFGEKIVISRAEISVELNRAVPVGVEVFDRNGISTGQYFDNCWRLHGSARLADMLAFGCADGVLLLEMEGKQINSRFIANPVEDQWNELRVGTLISHPNLDFMIGNFGREHLAHVFLGKDKQIVPFSLPHTYLQFELTKDGNYLLVLDQSGSLNFHDPRTGEILSSLPLMDLPEGAPVPHFAVSSYNVYVVTPESGELLIVDIGSKALVGARTLPGSPARLAVVEFPAL